MPYPSDRDRMEALLRAQGVIPQEAAPQSLPPQDQTSIQDTQDDLSVPQATQSGVPTPTPAPPISDELEGSPDYAQGRAMGRLEALQAREMADAISNPGLPAPSSRVPSPAPTVPSPLDNLTNAQRIALSRGMSGGGPGDFPVTMEPSKAEALKAPARKAVPPSLKPLDSDYDDTKWADRDKAPKDLIPVRTLGGKGKYRERPGGPWRYWTGDPARDARLNASDEAIQAREKERESAQQYNRLRDAQEGSQGSRTAQARVPTPAPGSSTAIDQAASAPPSGISTHAFGFKDRLTDDERAELTTQAADPSLDVGDRNRAQMQLDLDESKWSRKGPKGSLTGDPAKDSRIRTWNEADARERQLAHRDLAERRMSPDRVITDPEATRLGLDVNTGTGSPSALPPTLSSGPSAAPVSAPQSTLTPPTTPAIIGPEAGAEGQGESIQVTGLRPDPYGIDARTRAYTIQNEPLTPNGFSDHMGLVDAQGRATPPTEDDIAYRQGVLLDQSYRNSIESLARQRAIEESQQAMALPGRQAMDAVSERVARERISSLDYFVRQHRIEWDRVRQAQREADAQYPNPDDLLGGRGTWGRALATTIAAIGGGIGMEATANVINAQLQSQIASQKSAYDRARQRVTDAQGNASSALSSAASVDALLTGQVAAAKERLADQLELIAAKTNDQVLQAKYQGMAAKLQQEAQKDLGTFATQTANRDIKNSQLMLSASQLEERRRQFDLRHNGNGGAGAVTLGTGSPEGLTKEQRARAVNLPGGGYVLTPNSESGNELRKRLAGYSQTIDHIDATIGLLNNIPGWTDKVKAKAGLTTNDIDVIANEVQQLSLAAKNGYGLGALAGPDMEILQQLGADPAKLRSLNWTADKWDAVLKNWRRGIIRDMNNEIASYSTIPNKRVNVGNPPEAPQRKSSLDYLRTITGPLRFDKTGAPAAPNSSETRGTIDSAVEASVRDGESPAQTRERLITARADLKAASNTTRTKLNEMKRKASLMRTQGQAVGAERMNAIGSVEDALKAQEAGIEHIDARLKGGLRTKLGRTSKDAVLDRVERDTGPRDIGVPQGK